MLHKEFFMAKRLKYRLRPHIVKLLQITKLNRLAHKIYYNHVHGFQAADESVLDAQKKCFEQAMASGVALNGDYLEFGVFKGYSLWHAQKVANDNQLTGMRFFGFDSFAGLPKVTEENDLSKFDVFYEGQYACDKEIVINNLDSKGIDWSITHLIDGYYNESLTADLKKQYKLDKVAIALIDCDLYSSTRDVLNFIADMIQDQTVLMFDDWNCYDRDNSKGQRKAFQEFFDVHQELEAEPFIEYGAYGQVYIINKKNR